MAVAQSAKVVDPKMFHWTSTLLVVALLLLPLKNMALRQV
jgi:hypothetical protein